ncbi:hypothetical protein GCM10010468_75990 [Actinocorallia longicatena]|uniref:Uncharacterized protein n=1 Tax=Actinocorallia longicatena TaxID=111803 RepID=A0ABP6QNI3_9ACTN
MGAAGTVGGTAPATSPGGGRETIRLRTTVTDREGRERSEDAPGLVFQVVTPKADLAALVRREQARTIQEVLRWSVQQEAPRSPSTTSD